MKKHILRDFLLKICWKLEIAMENWSVENRLSGEDGIHNDDIESNRDHYHMTTA